MRVDGRSIREIAILGVSKGSVSLWVRDIDLTQQQQGDLLAAAAERRKAGNRAWRQQRLATRRSFQSNGAQVAVGEAFSLHLAGCMLYWAEGAKDRNQLSFANSDPTMVTLFVRFLRECFDVPNERIRLRCAYYTQTAT